MNYQACIERRSSEREFDKKAVEQDQLDSIRNFYDEAVHRLIPDIRTELRVFTDDAKNRLEGVAGYMGYAFGAPAYLLLLSEEKEGYLENAGFIGEDLVLKLTDLGLDSCWMTVNDPEVVKQVLMIDSGLTVAAVLAVGYGKAKKAARRLDIVNPANVTMNKRDEHAAPKIALEDLAFTDRWGVRADWSDSEAGGTDPMLADALYAASLAPSFLNRQPYRFIAAGRNLILAYRQEDMTGTSDTHLDLGAAMLHFFVVYTNDMSGRGSWKMGIPEGSDQLGIPEEYQPAAYFDLY